MQPAPKELLPQEKACASDALNRPTSPAIARAAQVAREALDGICVDDLPAVRVLAVVIVFMVAFPFSVMAKDLHVGGIRLAP
jgi:hypothetical protein